MKSKSKIFEKLKLIETQSLKHPDWDNFESLAHILERAEGEINILKWVLEDWQEK
jgi:hypothetical protein